MGISRCKGALRQEKEAWKKGREEDRKEKKGGMEGVRKYEEEIKERWREERG